MKPSRSLERLQRWLQAVVTHPVSVEAGVEAAETRGHIDVGVKEVEQVITRSRSQTAVERLGIYSSAYYARLLECLNEEFTVVKHALGEEVFNSFAIDYLQNYPPWSYTLGHLGANFPRYLAESRPPREDDTPDWADFFIDLAKLERAFGEIFDGPGVEGQSLLDAAQLSAVPAERWPEARLTPVPCLRLLAFRFPVADYFSAVRREENPDLPEPAPSFLAVTRRRYVVRHFPITHTEHAVLSALVAGQTLGEAVEMAANEPGADFEQVAAQLGESFRVWAANGFFSAAMFSEA